MSTKGVYIYSVTAGYRTLNLWKGSADTLNNFCAWNFNLNLVTQY